MWSSMKILDQILPVSDLSESQILEMLHLMEANYENVIPKKFRSDLMKKDGVLLLTSEIGNLCGFSTYKLIKTQLDSKKYFAIFSGDTIIQKQYWGHFALFRSFAKLMNHFLELGHQPLYWFLITKGIRTYLMLPLFFKEFYPAFSKDTPHCLKMLMDQFGKELFDKSYHEENGIIRLELPADYLKSHLSEIPAGKLTNKHIQFFLEKNPGFVHGDELSCITEITSSNFTSATQKFIKYQ